ncbi:hypothetical protein JRO89_XS15G0011100 [Xanthoceras sorbifolium]|uniref:Integrase zinc-binding domain-containing protein n=1 Tax=Xanthoceras sorbifolium TaxID=99658 RepID=A0ABQ8H0M7_9ROSI|nr:hypothetical protein JRO89_XS15G0011100 [Xanthoceras sorbifolium]
MGRLNPDAFDPDTFDDWIMSLEYYFDWFVVPEDRKVQYEKLKLKGPAQLTVRSKTNETEAQILARYLKGLKADIRKEMLTTRLYNVEEAYQLALQLEQTSKRGTVGDGKGKTKAFGEGLQCYKCKRFRHFAVVCPIRDQRIAFVYEKDLMFQEEEKPNKKARAARGTHSNNWKRTNIFHTRVEHGDKALIVIIDNSSSMNVVAKEVVEWLGLPQEAHPMPYRVSGINDNNSVPVKNNCFVKFSLGKKYTNKTNTITTLSDFSLKDGFLTKNGQICVPKGSMREFILLELHGGGLAGHFRFDKTYLLVADRFYWPHKRRDFYTIVARCRVCQDLILPQAEFTYNNSINRTIGNSSFQLVYGIDPRIPLDTIALPLPQRLSEAGLDFVAHMQFVHEEVRRKIALQTNHYAQHANLKRRDKQFEVGAQVMIRLHPECFPSGSYSKLHALWAGPFQILKKLGPNAYVVDLPPTYTISPIFNVEDLTEFQWEVVSSNPLPDTPIKIPSIPRQPNNVATILDHQFVSTRRDGYYKFLVQ